MSTMGQAVKPLREDTTEPELDSLFEEVSCSAEGLTGAESNKRLEKTAQSSISQVSGIYQAAVLFAQFEYMKIDIKKFLGRKRGNTRFKGDSLAP
jgi:hypothetical protein